MIETDCLRELNVFGTNDSPTPDLLVNGPQIEEKTGCFPFRRKVNTCIIYIFLFYLYLTNFQKKQLPRTKHIPFPEHLLTSSQSATITATNES